MTSQIAPKLILLIIGGIVAVVGICINNWKVAAIGNTIGLSSLLFA